MMCTHSRIGSYAPGSTINIMSYELFSSLLKHSRTPIVTCCTDLDNVIIVANGQKVHKVGTSFVKIRVLSGKHYFSCLHTSKYLTSLNSGYRIFNISQNSFELCSLKHVI